MEAPRRTGHQLPPSLIWTTGIAIILFCVTGIAALMGWIPNSVGQGSGGGMPPPPEKAQLGAPLSPSSSGSPSPLAGARGSDANSYNSSSSPPPPPSAAQRAETRAAARAQARKAPLPAESGAPAHAQCASCGVVESVREVEAKGEGSGLGAVGGAVGGVVAGNEIEKRVKSSKHYEVAVRLDDGTRRVVSEANAPAWRQGDHVRIADGAIRAN